MVYGLEKFKEYFSDCTDQYVFIGGTACAILLEELGAPFRSTKDLDIVLIIEAIDKTFVQRFWEFLENAGYEHKQKSSGKDQFYRFSNPTHEGYPAVIELFSRKSEKLDLKIDNGLTPIHIDDSIISLSAILLNEEYYSILVSGKQIVNGYSILEIESIILFKIKAWLDLQEREEKGEKVDSKNLKKHKNDIFRLLVNVIPSTKIEVGPEIENDVKHFIEKIKTDRPDLKNLGIKNAKFEDMLALLERLYINSISG